MSTNTININATNNELYIIAFGWSASYQLAHIQSGNDNTVNVQISIVPGPYGRPGTLNGVNNSIDQNYTVYLPSGQYTIAGVGFNWGDVWKFHYQVNSNGPQQGFGPHGSSSGWVWNSNNADTITV